MPPESHGLSSITSDGCVKDHFASLDCCLLGNDSFIPVDFLELALSTIICNSFSAGGDASDGDDEDAEVRNTEPFMLRNQELVRKAFAGEDVVADFQKEKEERMQSEDEKVVDNTLAGWGHWIGAGIGKKAQRGKKKSDLSKQEGMPRAQRQDAKLDKVVINEKRVKKNAKYLASQLPHPFETRQQYERSLRLPLGPEWTTKETFQAATKPRVLMKQGIIRPMAKPMV